MFIVVVVAYLRFSLLRGRVHVTNNQIDRIEYFTHVVRTSHAWLFYHMMLRISSQAMRRPLKPGHQIIGLIISNTWTGWYWIW